MPIILGRPRVQPFVRTKAISSTYTVTLADAGWLLVVDTSGGNVTINLPAVATAGDGFVVTIKRISAGANTLTIDPSGAETVEGSATLSMPTQYTSVMLVSRSTGWFIGSAPIPLGRTVSAGTGLSGGGALSENITLAAVSASTSTAGIVELADTTETQALSSTTLAVTPGGLATIGAPLLLETLSTSSGSTVTSGTLASCRAFLILYEDVSGNSTAALQCNISSDNGSNWSGNFMPTSTQSAAYERSGHIWIMGTGSVGNKVTHAILGAASGGDAGIRTATVSSVTGVINKIRFPISAGSFDGGSIYIYGFR